MAETRTITAEEELDYAIHEALELAGGIKRDPQGQPSLARLRGKGVSTVKSWMYGLTERERIKHEDVPENMARTIINYFEQAIPKIERDGYEGDAGIRVDEVVDGMSASISRLKEAMEAIEAERKRKREAREARLPSDGRRARKLRIRAHLIGDIYDLADHLGIEHQGRADISNADAADLIDAISAKLDGQDFTEAAEALRQGKYTQAEAPSDYVAEVKYGNKYGL
jgi:hypothetical protein